MDLDLESGGVDLVPRLGGGTLSQHSLDLLCGDQLPVLVAQQVIQQHLEGERQVVHAQPVQTCSYHRRSPSITASRVCRLFRSGGLSFSSTAAVLARAETSG